MKTPTAGDYLAQSSLLRLLAVMGLVVAPHMLRVPLWVSLGVVGLGIWRALAALQQWRLPATWLKVTLVIVAFIGINASYGRLNGQHAGTALLVIMLALKLTEMRSRRDVLIVLALCYFTMLTHFLFSQEIWTVLYLFGCGITTTAVLIEANHAGGPLSPRRTLRMGTTFVLQALPLMLVMFVLFPRVPGPLWGLPADAGAARSGLSDSMSPGDIARLIQSDEVAFRVRFDGPVPPMNQRYWRGPVYSYFDGRTWRAPFRGDDYFSDFRQSDFLDAYQPAQIQLAGEPIRYEVTLEPHRQNWMFALDMPSPEALPPGSQLTGYYQLLSKQLIKNPLTYKLVSFPLFRLDANLSERSRNRAARLRGGHNPRARELARSWRAEGLDDFGIVNRALRHFRDTEFFYTLEPPKLGQNPVDEFLFETRRGFCEHYAGSFTMLMRAAGIPARVVTGYQGGELNQVGDYYVVRQSDAHAWSEVWISGEGWKRVDPTAAVAPDRIELGLSAALAPSELPGFLRRDASGLRGFWYWRLQAEVAWDYVNVAWDRWVIGFNPDGQTEFLGRFGLDSWEDMVLALTVLITAVMALIGLVVVRQARAARPQDRAVRLWRAATERLRKAGYSQAPAEGPRDFLKRVLRERPEWAPMLDPLLEAFLAARYLEAASEENDRKLYRALNAVRI